MVDELNALPSDEVLTETDDTLVASYDLLCITRAYNRKEITFEEWLKLTKEWAEQMIQRYGNP